MHQNSEFIVNLMTMARRLKRFINPVCNEITVFPGSILIIAFAGLKLTRREWLLLLGALLAGAVTVVCLKLLNLAPLMSFSAAVFYAAVINPLIAGIAKPDG